MAMRPDRRVAVVTGAASGIGQATVLRLAAEGWTVYAADIASISATVDSAAGDASACTVREVELDVRHDREWQSLIAAIEEEHGGVDALANIAGVVNRRSADTVVELTEDAWGHVLDTNLKGTWLGMKNVIPLMTRRGGGRIVNIASMAALRGISNVAAYSASKGGVLALTRQAAFDYGADGVLINAICPGTIDTGIFDGAPPAAKIKHSSSHIVPRPGLADEVASMVDYLIREGSFLTGGVYPVDGGWTARGSF